MDNNPICLNDVLGDIVEYGNSHDRYYVLLGRMFNKEFRKRYEEMKAASETYEFIFSERGIELSQASKEGNVISSGNSNAKRVFYNSVLFEFHRKYSNLRKGYDRIVYEETRTQLLEISITKKYKTYDTASDKNLRKKKGGTRKVDEDGISKVFDLKKRVPNTKVECNSDTYPDQFTFEDAKGMVLNLTEETTGQSMINPFKLGDDNTWKDVDYQNKGSQISTDVMIVDDPGHIKITITTSQEKARDIKDQTTHFETRYRLGWWEIKGYETTLKTKDTIKKTKVKYVDVTYL